MTLVYEDQLDYVRVRKEEIRQISLEDISYNEEWRELCILEDSLIRIIKIVKERHGNS